MKMWRKNSVLRYVFYLSTCACTDLFYSVNNYICIVSVVVYMHLIDMDQLW